MGRVSENKYTNVLRAPHHVALDITNKCNLRCLHCYNSSGENEVMHDELTSDELFVFCKGNGRHVALQHVFLWRRNLVAQ